jgi:glycosyltransferase involved in cell wall biosynthesis
MGNRWVFDIGGRNHDSFIFMQTSVFILPRGLELGGVTTWSMQMTRYLIEGGSPACLLRHQEAEPLSDDGITGQLPVVRCPGKPAWSVNVRDLEDYQPTYQQLLPGILIPNWTFGTYAACARLSQSHSRDMRVIGVAHSDDELFYAWLVYYEPIIHFFVAVSAEIANALKTRLPHRANDIVVRACAVEVERQLAKPLSLGAEPIRLMYAGRVQHQQKRIYDLLRLAQQLHQRQVNFKLTIVGDGSECQWLQTQFDHLLGAAQTKVSFVGRVDPAKMPLYWQWADIGLLVSDFEGTSISMLEAMSHGCVPVVTNVSGTRAVIEHGVNGFRVPVGDMVAMAGIIQTLATDRVKLQQIGTKAHQTVLEQYAFADYVPWFKALTERVWAMPARAWQENQPLFPNPMPTQPRLTRYQRGMNKMKRMVWYAQLMIELYGVGAIPWMLRSQNPR